MSLGNQAETNSLDILLAEKMGLYESQKGGGVGVPVAFSIYTALTYFEAFFLLKIGSHFAFFIRFFFD